MGLLGFRGEGCTSNGCLDILLSDEVVWIDFGAGFFLVGGGKGGCKVVPRNFLSVLKHYIQISITTSLHLSPTSPPSPSPSPSPRLPSPIPTPPRAQPNPCTHSPYHPPPPQNFPMHTPTFRTPPSISSHLIPSHPSQYPDPATVHTYAAHHPSYLLSSHLLHTHPTLHLCPHTTPSHLLIHSASSRFSVLSSSHLSHARVPVACVISVDGCGCVLRGLGDLGVVRRCGKGRGGRAG